MVAVEEHRKVPQEVVAAVEAEVQQYL